MSDFLSILSSYENQKIRLNLHKNGPDSVEGVVKIINGSYVVLESDNGELVIYPESGISALAVLPSGENRANDSADEKVVSSTNAKLLDRLTVGEGLLDFLAGCRLSMVAVGRSGPEAVRGFLINVGTDFISIAPDMHEIVHIPVDSIKSLTIGTPYQSRKRDDKS